MKNLFLILVFLGLACVSCTPKGEEPASTPKTPPPASTDATHVTTAPVAAAPVVVPSGEATAHVVGALGDVVLFFAGDYVAKGSPFKKLIAVGSDGKIVWSYTTNGAMGLAVKHSADMLRLEESDGKLVAWLNGATGQVLKLTEQPKVTAFDYTGDACSFANGRLTCKALDGTSWGVQSATANHVRYFEKHICFVGPGRSVQCHERAGGKKVVEAKVPIIKTVKNPEALNFSYVFHKGVLYIARYDGTISLHR